MAHADKEWQRLGDGSLLTEDADVGLGHIVSLRTYFSVYFSLLLLTAITVWAASQDFGAFSLFVALAIATVKAGIVTLFFMHLNFESKIIWGIVIYPLFIFGLIMAGTLGDQMVKRQARPAVLMTPPAADAPTAAPAGVTPAVDQPGADQPRADQTEREPAAH